jgi:bacillolysin/neutral peptidase B
MNLSWHRADNRIPEGAARLEQSPTSVDDALSGVNRFTPPRRGSRVENQTSSELAEGYISEFLRGQSSPSFFGELQLSRAFDTPFGTRICCFVQVYERIVLFGKQAIAEIDAEGEVVALDIDLEQVSRDLTMPLLTPEEAKRVIAAAGGVGTGSLAKVPEPSLTFVFDVARDEWRPTYWFVDIPFGRAGVAEEERGPFVVAFDAADASVVGWYSSAKGVVLPVECRTLDEDGILRLCYGSKSDSGQYVMRDPLWGISTFDLQYADITDEHLFPTVPVWHDETALPATMAAAVIAHGTVARIVQFFQSLLRNGALGEGSDDIVVVVNCTDRMTQPPPEWRSAMWWKHRLWFGQTRTSAGGLQSIAHHTDVAAHELMHGVIERTCGLIYNGETGALTESLCDIFGVVSKNFLSGGPVEPLGTWSWSFGDGLGLEGKPLRNLSEPIGNGGPSHMNAWVAGRAFHANAGIHTVAAHAFATSTSSILSGHDFALLYYLTLVQLPPDAKFANVLRTIVRTVKTMWEGNATRCGALVKAAEDAYRLIGVEA